MTLSEAIKHCEERIDCSECGKEYKQLAEWLTELKMMKLRVKTALYKRFHEEDTNITMVPLGEVIKFCDELLSTKDVTEECEQK